MHACRNILPISYFLFPAMLFFSQSAILCIDLPSLSRNARTYRRTHVDARTYMYNIFTYAYTYDTTTTQSLYHFFAHAHEVTDRHTHTHTHTPTLVIIPVPVCTYNSDSHSDSPPTHQVQYRKVHITDLYCTERRGEERVTV